MVAALGRAGAPAAAGAPGAAGAGFAGVVGSAGGAVCANETALEKHAATTAARKTRLAFWVGMIGGTFNSAHRVNALGIRANCGSRAGR